MWSTMNDPQNAGGTPPHNPTVAFERRDVNIRGIVWFVFGLVILIGTAILTVFGVYAHLSADRERITRSQFPIAEKARQAVRKADPAGPLPPTPRLDGIVNLPPTQEPGRMFPAPPPRQTGGDQDQALDSWHWANADHTVASIPIADAISRLVKSGALKAKPGSKPPAGDATGQPSETNSGRMP
jgi:hypothetical protein